MPALVRLGLPGPKLAPPPGETRPIQECNFRAIEEWLVEETRQQYHPRLQRLLGKLQVRLSPQHWLSETQSSPAIANRHRTSLAIWISELTRVVIAPAIDAAVHNRAAVETARNDVARRSWECDLYWRSTTIHFGARSCAAVVGIDVFAVTKLRFIISTPAKYRAVVEKRATMIATETHAAGVGQPRNRGRNVDAGVIVSKPELAGEVGAPSTPQYRPSLRHKRADFPAKAALHR